MSVGRNDPCPCGSGRKYKHCCMEQDRVSARLSALPPHVRETARTTPVWEAAVVPVGASIDDSPAARPAVVLVVAGDAPLHTDFLEQPSSEPDEVAAVLADAVVEAGEAVGALPLAVQARDAEVRGHLDLLLKERGVEVAEEGPMPGLTEIARSMLEHLTGGWPPASNPDTWRAWGMSPARTSSLFAAAAAYYRARPWDTYGDHPPLLALMPSGRAWTLSVLGAAGEIYGLALYSDPADYLVTMTMGPDRSWENYTGRVFSLLFGPRGELPRKMQREVAAAGWEVAAPEAYPLLMVLAGPGGGLAARDWDDLTQLLRAFPPYLEAVREPRSGDIPGMWTDVESGLTILAKHPDPTRAPLPSLTPGGPEGPRADPWAALALDDPEVWWQTRGVELIGGFDAYLTRRGLAASTIDKHLRNAVNFLVFLVGDGQVPPCAMHEYDLLTFLYDWVHRAGVVGRTAARAMPASLKHFLAYLAKYEGLEFPWARSVLSDLATYRRRLETYPDRPWRDTEMADWTAELVGEFSARLFLHDEGLGEDDRWENLMGPTEWRQRRELQRRWLIWREELIASGLTDTGEVFDALLERQRGWERTPRADLGGRSPLEVVRASREEEHEDIGADGD